MTSYDAIVSELPYRVLAAMPPDPHLAAWAALRRRRLKARIALGVLGYAAATALAATMTGKFVFDGPKRLYTLIALGVAVAVVLLAAAVAVNRRFVPFVCPRCGESFFEGLFMEIGFSKTCAHCGVAIGTPMSACVEGVVDHNGDALITDDNVR